MEDRFGLKEKVSVKKLYYYYYYYQRGTVLACWSSGSVGALHCATTDAMDASGGTLKITAQRYSGYRRPFNRRHISSVQSSTLGLKSQRTSELKRPHAQAHAQAQANRDSYPQAPIASGQLPYLFRCFFLP
jgi:hypothetical protein